MIADTNSEDRLVQATFAEHLHDVLGWESVYAHVPVGDDDGPGDLFSF